MPDKKNQLFKPEAVKKVDDMVRGLNHRPDQEKFTCECGRQILRPAGKADTVCGSCGKTHPATQPKEAQ